MSKTRNSSHSSDDRSVPDNLPPVRSRSRTRPASAARSVPPLGTDAAAPAAQPKHSEGEVAVSPPEGNDAPQPYAIGYGKPPKYAQFRKGQSGNPKGRRKGSRNTRTIFEEESQRLVDVTENGKTRKLTKRELVLKTIVNKAAKGDEKAQIKFLKLDERFSQNPATIPGATVSTHETMAELTAADQIILERYRSLHGGVPTSDPAKDTPAPGTGS